MRPHALPSGAGLTRAGLLRTIIPNGTGRTRSRGTDSTGHRGRFRPAGASRCPLTGRPAVGHALAGRPRDANTAMEGHRLL
jgi:hypothetical protein